MGHVRRMGWPPAAFTHHQLRVLGFQHLHALGFGYVHPAEFGLPLTDAGIAHSKLAAKFQDRCAILVIQNADDV